MGSLLLAIIYLCFISFGLPDSLLGSAWPILHIEIDAPLSSAGIISATIFVGTILSSLYSDKLLCKFGAGKVTAVSVLLTAVGLLGYSISNNLIMLILWSIPYGVGAGGVDAILNNYVALNYKAQHMSWLHCMWGLGACISPYIMSYSLISLNSWNYGYLIVSIIQVILTVIIFISLPLWKGSNTNKLNIDSEVEKAKPLTFKQIFKINGAIPCFLMFFCYCSMELTATLWSSTYLVNVWNFEPEIAAGFASMFYIGMTFGRFVNGFLAMKFSDKFLIRIGTIIVFSGIILLFLPFNSNLSLIGFVIIGLGCAPIYPCIIHMTPCVFGENNSQAMIGVQMAFAYIGFLIMPPIFGVVAEFYSVSLLPVFLFVLLVLIYIMHELVVKTSKKLN